MAEERKREKGEQDGEVEVEKDEVTASTASRMETLCKYIYSKDDSNRIRTRAMLCHVYFLALHDRWYEARDLMLMSHLQENIQHSDIPTQVNLSAGRRAHVSIFGSIAVVRLEKLTETHVTDLCCLLFVDLVQSDHGSAWFMCIPSWND